MSAATVPVLLMNPGGKRAMARRLPPRIKSGPKKGQFRKRASGGRKRRSTKSRRRRNPVAMANPTTHRRRRRRRRRNPGKLDAKAAAIALLGGGVVAGANYALDGVDKITNKQQAWGVAGGGTLLGLLASMASAPLGLGIIGGAVGLGGYKLATLYIEKEPQTVEGLGQVGYDPWGRRLGYPAMRSVPALGMTQADLAAVQAQLGATTADLSAVQADLGAVFADYELG